jgi:hypothetical protein
MDKRSLAGGRRLTVLAVAGTVTVVVALVLWLFQPWRLWTSSSLDEAAPRLSPPATTPQAPAATSIAGQDQTVVGGELSFGTFVSHEHRTRGQARLLRLPDGTRVLRLEDLDTSDGPALHVWLSDRPVTPDGWRVFDDGEHLDLGALKANRGNHNYTVPTGADLTRLTSVSIWCARFRVSFGAADLSPTAGRPSVPTSG